MTPEVERFLHLATRPLEKRPDDREEAKAELMSRLSQGGRPLETLSLTAPSARLAAAPVSGWRRRGVMLGCLVLVVAGFIAALLVWAGELIAVGSASTLTFGVHYGDGRIDDNFAIRHLDRHIDRRAPGLPLHVRAGENFNRASQRASEANSDDLGLLHLAILGREADEPKEFSFADRDNPLRRRADALDGDNAHWPLLQAESFVLRETGRERGRYWFSSTSSSLDEEALDVALGTIEEASERPLYRDPVGSLRRRQLLAFGPGRGVIDHQIGMAVASMGSMPEIGSEHFLQVLLNAGGRHYQGAGDEPELRHLEELWRHWVRWTIEDLESGGAPDRHLINRLESAGRGLSEHRPKVPGPAGQDAFNEALVAASRDVAACHLGNAKPDLMPHAGLRLQAMGTLPGDLTHAELKPSRLAEYALFDRGVAFLFLFLVLVATAFCGFEGHRRKRTVTGLSKGLQPLLGWRDQLWIGALGLLLPFLWWWGITRLTPLGQRDLGLWEWVSATWLLQWTAFLILCLVMLFQAVQWRWSRQGEFLGLRRPWSSSGWVIGALAGLAIPAAGLLRHLDLKTDDAHGLFLLAVAGSAAAGLLWLLWMTILNLFTPGASALRANLIMRTALPWCLALALMALAAQPLLRLAEAHWHARDPLLPVTTSGTHANALEERLARGYAEALAPLGAESP